MYQNCAHTHDSHKEIAENEGSYPYPGKNVEQGNCRVTDFDDILVNVVPLVQCEQLEQCEHGVRNVTRIATETTHHNYIHCVTRLTLPMQKISDITLE